MSDTWDSAPIASQAPAAPVPSWDSAPLVGPSAQQKAVVDSNSMPEEAARALTISKQTKIPATVVQSNLSEYEDHARQQSAVKATANPAIAKYIDGNPMAAKVSADDYGKLDEFSYALSLLHPEVIKSQAQGGLLAGVQEVGDLLQSEAGRTKLTNALTVLPYHLAKGMYDFAKSAVTRPGEVYQQGMTSGEDQDIALGIGIALAGGGPKGSIKVGRTDGVPPAPPTTSFDDFMHTLEGMKTRKEIDDFIASKTPGPPGAMLQIEHAKAGGQALDRAVEVAQESKTKERSPELFEEAAQAHDPGNVHVDAQKILDLYSKEGKVPAEGDGLFGFVPDIAAKAQAAAATGGEVTIPVSKYIAHVDPTVHEGLKDSVRLHDDGVTTVEAKELEKEISSFDPEAPKEAQPTEPANIEKKNLGLDTSVFMNILIEKGQSIGITENEFKAYSDKVARQEQNVLDKAVASGKREAGRRLTPEWKRNEAATRDEVIGDLTLQGAFAAEKFLRENKIELGGDNIDKIADDLAPLWGFETGNDLREALIGLETEQAASGKNVQAQLKDAITAETARRMEEKHGNLAENIAKEAREIALADHTFDVLADEVRLLAKAAGTTQALSRAEMVAYGKDIFERSNVTEAGNWEKARRAVERSGREAEKALLKGDFQEAFQWKQRQMIAAMVAKQSAELQGLIDRTEKKIDRWQSNETIKGLDQAHLEQIRQVLASIGLPQHFAPLADTPALRDFAAQSEGQIAAAPWLMDGSQPKLQDMSVEQFRDLAKSLDSIAHVGRQVEKLFSAGKEAELQNVVFDAVRSMERFPFKDQPNRPNFLQRLQSYGRQIIGAHLLVERVLDYTDQFNPHGPLTEWLDRPLRDANSKEIVLTEQVVRMLRDLRPHTTTETNALIDNKLIPDVNDKTGFLRMTHHELRTLMLNSGNWSNLGKMTKGFGVNEADLRRFIDQHASPADVAFVNGIWKVFDHLKPEADAVQLRDTGVPVDTIEGVPWEVKNGKLNGGYYPLSYDPYNSDIQGHLASPLFDKGYYAATTPHGYTQERTNYAGALDLSGTFLNSKIRGMVHDIAFREAVRNANKLIENQEFRTAVAQYWGKEVADLFPGWLRDIANSHNLDDNYAQGLVRGTSLIRQNVVSTLIAFNPGTFIKHGFTALVMSTDRVGGGKLASAMGDLGLKTLGKNASELLWKSDTLPDEAFMQSFRDALDQGKRGDNARQFVLQSSAVMRQRQAQWNDSIYGAVQQLQNAGVAQTLAEFRQRAMLYGRLGVAYSDQFSAMPTWLAAYKNAYAKGETHEDAVFQADKEVSRAHGSSFVGDKPRVSRTGNSGPGEFVKWFTGLYNFWNHQFNNLLSLVWDTSARINGRPEPNADWASITKRIGYVAGIVLIEEMASAAKDEDHRSLGMKMASATLRYLGGSFVGLREITNGLAHGYEPSTGMLGTLFKAMSDTSKDLAKATSLKAGVAKDAITHTATLLGFATGVGGSQLGKVGQFGHDVAVGKDRPRTFNDYRQGLRTGHSKARTH